MAAQSADDSQPQSNEAFVQLLTAEQLRLLHYIAMLLGNPEEARNVLQETNLVLWRKSHEFEPGTSFSAWSRKVAYWQVRAFVRDRQRDKHVFDEHLIGQIATADPPEAVEPEVRVALRHCLSDISTNGLEMLTLRYERNLSIKALAEKIGKTESMVKVSLLRIRRALLKCIKKQLAMG